MILKVKGVSKSFGSQQVLKPITFEVGEGERICILGPSGCGKSTLLQMIAGLQRIDTGEVEMAGAVVERGNIMFHRKTGLLIWCFKIMPSGRI